MNIGILDSVTLDSKVKASVNYAKARAVIDLASSSRKERRQARNIVIEHLGGKLDTKHIILFPDNSKAKY